MRIVSVVKFMLRTQIARIFEIIQLRETLVIKIQIENLSSIILKTSPIIKLLLRTLVALIVRQLLWRVTAVINIRLKDQTARIFEVVKLRTEFFIKIKN